MNVVDYGIETATHMMVDKSGEIQINEQEDMIFSRMNKLQMMRNDIVEEFVRIENPILITEISDDKAILLASKLNMIYDEEKFLKALLSKILTYDD